MGELILCNQPLAGVPYYMEQGPLNLYSIEELCWFIVNHAEDLDESFLSAELLGWLEKELHMGDTVRRIREGMREHADSAGLMGILLDSNGFCTEQEKKEVKAAVCDISDKSEQERLKIRGDRKVKSHHYHEAIRIYLQLLHSEDATAMRADMIGNIWNNMGVAYTGLFQYREAARCFGKAYQYNNDPKCLRELEDANHMAMKEQTITEIQRENSENLCRNLDEVDRQRQTGNEKEADRMLEKQIWEWRQSYERNEK